MCVVSSSFCCYQPLMFCQLFINLFYQLLYQHAINMLSTFYQLFINFFNFFSTLFQHFINPLSTFHQLFINFYQLFINCLSTGHELFINLEEMITFDICETLFALLPGHAMFLFFPAVARPESQHTLSWCPGVSSHALLDKMLLVNSLQQ